MRSRTKLVSVLLGTLLVLGIPPMLVLTAVPSSKDNPAGVRSNGSLRALIARQSTLELFYLGWQKSYLDRGGDRNVDILVGWLQGLSTEPSEARGRVRLNLIDGTIRAEVQGLQGQPADLWLVDNQEGPGRTVRPEPGDRMIRIGRLQTQGGAGRVAAGPNSLSFPARAVSVATRVRV